MASLWWKMIIEFYFILIIATFCRVGLTTAADLDPELRVVEGAAGRDEGMALATVLPATVT